jgi:hypothetical protein
MTEYVNKKWDLPTMEKKLELLKKVIPAEIVDLRIGSYLCYTEDRLDALYLAYYSLKDEYCKIKRRSFGEPKKVEYKPKTVKWYDSNEWTISNDYTWTVTTAYSTSTTTTSSYYWTDNGWR